MITTTNLAASIHVLSVE